MSKIGLKYVSSEGMGFPAINGGKWNIATNFWSNYNKMLTEAAIEEDDDETPGLFLKYIPEGRLICAVRRCFSGESRRSRSGFEALWMFIPDAVLLTATELSNAVRELLKIFTRPEAFTNISSYEDILPEIFKKDFPAFKLKRSGRDYETKEERVRMTGQRIGFIEYDNDEELGVILAAGFSRIYKNFGLILLTDNSIPVESSLPRIFLPKLSLFRHEAERTEKLELEAELKQQSETEERAESEGREKEAVLLADIESEEIIDSVEKEQPESEGGHEDEYFSEDLDQEEVENEEKGGKSEDEKVGEGIEPDAIKQNNKLPDDIKKDSIIEGKPTDETQLTADFRGENNVCETRDDRGIIESWKSFWIGFIISTLLFVIFLLIR